MRRDPITPLALMIALGPSLNVGCAEVARRQAREREVRHAVDEYRFAGSLDELAGAVSQETRARGYQELRVQDGASYTEWRAMGEQRTRLRIEYTIGPPHRFELHEQRQDLSPPVFGNAESIPATEVELAVMGELGGSGDPRQHVYGVSEQVLRDTVERQLQRRGAIAQASYGFPIRTMWQEPGTNSRSRYVAAVVPDGAGRRLSIDRVTETEVGVRSWGATQSTRDIWGEVDVIERLDPQRAQTIRGAANTAGEQAYDDAVDRGAISCSGCGMAC